MIQRGIDGPDPVQPETGGRIVQEERRRARTSHVASGTLACPSCDAPVVPARPVSPAEAMDCPYCAHSAHVRDFLSLAAPARPAHVDVRIVQGGRA